MSAAEDRHKERIAGLPCALGAARKGVPREPTQAMIAAADPIYNDAATCRNVWRSMYDAVPPPPAVPEAAGSHGPADFCQTWTDGSAANRTAAAPVQDADTVELEKELRGPYSTAFPRSLARRAATALAAQRVEIARRESRMLDMHSELDLTHENLERAEAERDRLTPALKLEREQRGETGRGRRRMRGSLVADHQVELPEQAK